VEDLAKALNINVNKYLDLEAGKTKPTTAQALLLSDIYFLEASIFLSDEKPMININAGSNNRMVINLFTNNYHESKDQEEQTEEPEHTS